VAFMKPKQIQPLASPGHILTPPRSTDALQQSRSSRLVHEEADPRPSAFPRKNSRDSQQQSAGDLVRLLRQQATARADQPAFVFLLDGQTSDATWTYAQLDRRARAVAARLQEEGLCGERIVLAYPPGLEFIAGFFGCLYAGCTAVPTYLPHRRTLDRFNAIFADAGARLVLSTAHAAGQHQAMVEMNRGHAEAAPPIPWIASDDISDAMAKRWTMPVIVPQTLAMLQYTSGSTSQPKGVMLSHANLIHNTGAIFSAFGMGDETSVFWLPAYHDMGLIGGVLEPILAGVTSVLMAPAAFLQRPIAWLAAISKYKATISGGPNFAYDLCVRKITDEQRATLDLSSWSLAFVGAEPIQPDTLERFAKAFAPCGFSASAFYPCYGMAEATLMISGAKRGSGAITRSFDESALAANKVVLMPDDASGARRLVSCGTPVDTMRVAIIDPQTRVKTLAGCVGEVCVEGESIGQGYWRNPEQTRQTFDGHLASEIDHSVGPYLRTGDLGFFLEDQLYVTGRLDDMLIIRGLNHHPQDMEITARMSHPLLEAGLGAAFAVESQDDLQITLVHEVARNGDTDFAPVMEAVRAAVLAEHGLVLHTIALVRCGTIPRTSSGKVQRRACRAALLGQEITILAKQVFAGAGDGGADYVATFPAPHTFETSILATICQHALALSGAALSDVTPGTRLTALGLDSLKRAELAAALEKAFACRLPDTDFSPAQTLSDLAHTIQAHMSRQSALASLAQQIPREHYEFAHFPEYGELKRYERMLKAVAGENPYFRVDQGGTSSATVTRTGGRERVNFCAYDYIGMAHDPQVAAAAKAAIDHYGSSAGASRLVCGEKQVHRDLERALATFLGTAAAIAFVSGHATNVTTIGHLMGPEDLIVHDVLAHNSIIQGALLSGATRRVFAHNDWHAMDVLLSEGRHRYRRVLIAIEGVYSMDGDYPDLPRFIELKKKHKALMLIDEAHSLGTMGPTGRGIGEHFGVARADVDLWMGTLSKSLASCGGYIAGSAELVEYLAYTAPGFVYSVGLPPSNAAAALAALNVLRAQPQRVTRLRDRAELFLKLSRERRLNTGLATGTPVVPIIVGSSIKSLRLARALFDRGINVQPILHPAVAEHSARLRFFITTHHTESQIRGTVSAIADELAKL